MRLWFTIAAAAATIVATVAEAQISAELAKQCRTMMLKAHPLTLYGKTGTAAAHREYFQECIRRNGKMDADATAPGKHEPM